MERNHIGVVLSGECSRKRCFAPVDSLDPPSWPPRPSWSSELEERPAHGPDPSFCALHPLLLQRGLTESLAGRFELVRVPHWSFTAIRNAARRSTVTAI